MDHMHVVFGGAPVPPGSIDDYVQVVRETALYAAYNVGLLPYPVIWLNDRWELEDPTSEF